MNKHKSLLLVCLLSSTLYVVFNIGRMFGESHFYSVLEHLAFIGYGLGSFLSCHWTFNRLNGEKSAIKTQFVSRYFVISSSINAVISSISFILIRAIAAYSQGSELQYWLPPLSGLLANITYTFVTIHLVIGALFLSYHFMQQANRAQIQQLNAEKHKAQAHAQLLQEHLSPHFLFNSLNALASLIPLDPKLAEQFVSRFSSLYRYILANRSQPIVEIEKELQFTANYLELMNIRFANAYRLNDQAFSKQPDEFIATGALQSCIENVIKHNQASTEIPLEIALTQTDDYLIISNPKRPKKEVVEKSQTGLENLNARYINLTGKAPVVINDGRNFIVKLPRINVLTS